MQITTVGLSGADPVGKLYYDGEAYVRLIRPEAEQAVRELFSSGLVRTLIERRFIPESDFIPAPQGISDDYGHTMAIRHAALTPLFYPGEWSFSMLRAAALRYLELLDIAFSYGYTLTDAHPFNFVFQGVTPVWVDFGSFRKISSDRPHPWLEEFLVQYVTPLRAWRNYPFIARKIMASPLTTLTLTDSIRLNFLPLGNGKISQNLCKVMGKLSCIDNNQSQKASVWVAKLIFGKKTQQRLASLRASVQSLKNEENSRWANYHRDFLVDGAVPPVLDDRLERIYERVNRSAPKSILELAGNAGVLSETLARRMPEASVTCTDYDYQAIDTLFLRMQKSPVSNLSFAVLNFMCTEGSSAEREPHKRFRSDCVLALAVTHHLLLTQGYSFGEIFSAIKKYARHTVLIEYMPLGLHDGVSAEQTPPWYTEYNFQHAFEKYFTLNAIDKLEENRTLFCGSIR